MYIDNILIKFNNVYYQLFVTIRSYYYQGYVYVYVVVILFYRFPGKRQCIDIESLKSHNFVNNQYQ